MDLGCVNCGLWTVEVVVGSNGGGWGFKFAYCSSESLDDRFVVFFFFFIIGNGVYYFIVVDILFYCDVYIILLC